MHLGIEASAWRGSYHPHIWQLLERRAQIAAQLVACQPFADIEDRLSDGKVDARGPRRVLRRPAGVRRLCEGAHGRMVSGLPRPALPPVMCDRRRSNQASGEASAEGEHNDEDPSHSSVFSERMRSVR
jgi:hypothetical protein